VVALNTAEQLLLEKRLFWGGLEGFFLSDELADLLNLPARASGFSVKTVAKNSPSGHAGLRGSRMIVRIGRQDVPLEGDSIMSVGGISMTPANSVKIRDMISCLSPGASYKVSVLRAGQVLELIGKVP
jgi:S1-C subfamily serine protease